MSLSTPTTVATSAAALPCEDGDETEEVRVLTLALLDRNGVEYEVRVDEQDWDAALALTPEWRIFDHYGSPLVAARDGATWRHPHRSRKYFWLTLADFIAQPAPGETTRHLDGQSLNCTKPNLVTRRKGARADAKPKADRPWTREEERMNDIALAVFAERASARCGMLEVENRAGQGPSDTATPAADEAPPPATEKRKRTRRPGARRGTPGTTTPAAGGPV